MTQPSTADHAALRQARGAMLARLRRDGLFMAVMTLLIALLLTVIDRGSFGVKLIYSVSIGLCCWALASGIRIFTIWGADRARIARGLPLATANLIGLRGMLPLVLLSVLVGPPLGLWIADSITGLQSPSLLKLDSAATRFTLTITVIAALAATFVITTLERLASARTAAESAQRLAAENQLKLLESQLEPHMLFNTLANLRVLIGVDPVRAQAMLDRLIGFLRATLAASRTRQHALVAEFDRLADYLALMQVRMGARLQVQMDLPAALRQASVPPLLLQPLVENSIKHGLEPKLEGGRIEVQASQEGSTLVLQVRDSGVGPNDKPAPANAGVGLALVRERLVTLYGEQASLTLQAAPTGSGTWATIRLPASTL